MPELTASTECHCCRESFQYADEPDAWQLATCPGCDLMQWFCDECVDEAKSSYFPADRPIQHGQVACGSAYILGCSGCLGCVYAERIRTAGPLNPDAWWIGRGFETCPASGGSAKNGVLNGTYSTILNGRLRVVDIRDGRNFPRPANGRLRTTARTPRADPRPPRADRGPQPVSIIYAR